MSDLDFTKTQLAVFGVILLLAVDDINPVKILLHVFTNLAPWHIASVSIFAMVYVFISELKPLLYFAVKVFFHSILSIFFREVQIVGRDNIPRYGPVIFVGNHANQFIDGLMMLCTCEHKISYLIAEKSWNRRVIGDLAWALDAVPVKRAQDSSQKGIGTITMGKTLIELQTSAKDSDDDDDNNQNKTKVPLIEVEGFGTKFTKQLTLGDKIRPPGVVIAMKVVQLESDTSLFLDATGIDQQNELPTTTTPVTFEILKKVDQKVVYEKVLDKLASGGAIGIFPEGGSHDRTDLLPLKVGVALIAYSALEKDGITVPIIPVGLNYFRGHRFRGRAVVEYGKPVFIEPSTLKDYKTGGSSKRIVCSDLLDRIQDSMKSVIVTTPDYDSLQLIHTARRLYQRKELEASQKQDLSRRFAEGYKQLVLAVGGDPPEEFVELQNRLEAYQRELTELGIRDYQVSGLDREKDILLDSDARPDDVLREIRLPYQIAHVLVLMLLAALPAIFLNLPVGLIARLYAESRRKKALAKSKVKIRAYDVMLSEKVVLCIVLVPTFWVLYGLSFYYFTSLDGPAIALFFFAMPLFSYMSIMWAEAGMVDLKDLRPYVMRLFPSSRRRLAALPATRKKLQHDLRSFIKRVGPLFGQLYYGKEVNWSLFQEMSRKGEGGLTDSPSRASFLSAASSVESLSGIAEDERSEELKKEE
eukprot:CAMPEP_0202449092 /NCGR_PEP_ID=MMETSP1360-20130828/7852_1 /ASSEMBLY_ACC=CAM_ASM_000848 /TAXON_ID=515479 /ORGANISM="Licmophora paradoxa, Strain CCMP2313" /LENGTH=698 /DNA_ID=CAMNT_0049066911 /DNA_START=78 /DNA_END=2174 /DNA_ORIENTATION=+